MRKFEKILFFGGLALFSILIYLTIISDWKISNEFDSHWNLCRRSSTINDKVKHMDLLMNGIDKAGLSGHDALWLNTPSNSYDSNYMILKNYQQRLHESQCIDITTFDYQTAMSQFIQCEEDFKVNSSYHVITGIWFKIHYLILWNWIGTIIFIVSILMFFVGGLIWLLIDE